MITYHQERFQFFSSLFRVHGSPLYRSIIPSLFSSAVLVILEITSPEPSPDEGVRWFNHPYPITCVMVAFTFLLTFKCSFSYNRYWEAVTAVHQMQSKWLDVGMELAAFHLQSERFGHIRPPAFGSHPHIDHIVRKRERLRPMTPMKLQEMLVQDKFDDDSTNANDLQSEYNLRGLGSFDSEGSSSPRQKFRPLFFRRKRKSKQKIEKKNSASFMDNEYHHNASSNSSYSMGTLQSINTTSHHDESNSLAAGVFNSPPVTTLGSMNKRSAMSRLSSVPDLSGGMTKKSGPSLFLQEASHLLSLMSAVSFATLRNDIETAESPLKHYKPGSPWPPVDPDAHGAGEYKDFYNSSNFITSFRYLFGIVRTPAQRTVYNACRPFTVLGGVSDAEIEVLQRARGPLAKTALCTMWLQEFISREFLNGALGGVSPPIVSRLFQYTSDGMLGYNQARKVAYVPFPFPHSQLTTFFLIVVTCFMPILMLTFVPEVIVAAILNTMAVSVFFGLWLVANELEDPFRNVPNDIPLNTFQAQFNEALICMFAGFHPEAWWDIDEEKKTLGGTGENMVSQIGSCNLKVGGASRASKKRSTLENVSETTEMNNSDFNGTTSECGSL